MVRILAIIVFIFSAANAYAVWEIPNLPTSGIGDPGNFYLNQTGTTLSIMNNDYIGATDKLMTASGTLAAFYVDGKHGWEISAYRRLIQPILKPKFGDPVFDPPKGIYGDQLEARLAYSYYSEGIKFEISGNNEYYAGLNGHRITKFIHKVIGAKDETDKYGKKIDNSYAAGAVGIGIGSEKLLAMLYAHESPVMREVMTRVNLKLGNKDVQWGFQVEGVHQIQSDFYGKDIEDFRYGYGLSMKWFWYQFTLNYVSPYLKYDKHGQFFVSPIILSLEF